MRAPNLRNSGSRLDWEAIAWRGRVSFVSLLSKIRPKDHIDLLRDLLPSRYLPLQDSGSGNSVCLFTTVADVLIGLIGKEASIMNERSAGSVLQMPAQIEDADLEMWEHHIEFKIESDRQIPETDCEALIVARRVEVFSRS